MHRVPRGTASGRAPREWLPALVLALLLASTAAADVTIKETTVSEGLGGFGNGTTHRTMIVAGDASRSEDEATYTGRFKTLAGGGKPRTTVSITRIDREVVWDLDPLKKTYTELTFAEMRELMARGLAQADESAREAEPQDADMTFTVDVKRTGAKETVNGFAAEQVVVTSVGRPKDAGPEARDREVRIVMDLWLTKSAPGAKEMAEFGRRFAAKMGIEAQVARIGATAQRMYGGAMKEMGEKLKDLDGYPVRSTFTVAGAGGPPAASSAGSPAAGPAQGAGAAAERERAKAEAEEQEKAQDRQDAGDIASSAASAGGVTGKLGGLLGRKLAGAAQKKAGQKVEKSAGEKTAPGAAGGHLLKVVTEVTSITTSPAPAGSFEVPAGYKLQKRD
jgi:hypothetical protein